MLTPWGEAFDIEVFARGFIKFSTSAHGGVGLTLKFALKNLTYSAIRRGIIHNNYVYYEEDCNWAIPLWELEQYWDKYFTFDYSKEECREAIYKCLTLSNMDYLIEKGDLAEQDIKNFIKEEKSWLEISHFHFQSNPDKIINAINATIVTTEDGKIHYVTEDSFQKQRKRKFMNQSKYVSECKKIMPEILTYPSNSLLVHSYDPAELEELVKKQG